MIFYFTLNIDVLNAELDIIDPLVDYPKDLLQNAIGDKVELLFEYDSSLNTCVLVTSNKQLVINSDSNFTVDYNPLRILKND